MTFCVIDEVRYPKTLGESSKGQLWPYDVTKGHHSFLANNFWPQSDYGEILYLVTSSDVIFDLSEKMTGVLSVDLLPSFRMPFAACRYVA